MNNRQNLWTDLLHYPGVSIADSEQVITGSESKAMTDSRTTMTKRLAVLLNDDHKHSPHETTSLLKFLFTILYLMTEFLFLNNFAKGWKVSWKVVLNSEILPLPWKSKVWRHKVNFLWLQDKNLKIWYTFFELSRTSRKWFVFPFYRSVSNLSKHLCWSLFLIKLPACRKLYWKETPTQVFSYCYCEIFKNTCFEKHLRKTASDLYDYYFPIFL